MSLHYFVDGYNLIQSSERLAQGALWDRREKLLKFIEEKRPQGRNRVTVVFDGREDVTSDPHRGETQVLFSVGRDADSVIKQRVDDLANPRNAVVVTDDRAIQKWVRGVGARVMSCEAFLKAGADPAALRRPAPELDPQAAAEINEELKKLWKL